jgi:uncharacterized protein (TIGR02217 family)
MTFYAIQIEQCPGFGWQGGAEFDTLIRSLESGRNRRRPRRYVGLHRYVSPMNNIPIQAARAIKKVHMAMLGSAHTFLHWDYLDNEAIAEPFGTGDGATAVFQLIKTYDPGGGATYVRDITKPDDDVVIYVNGVADPSASVDPLTGLVDFGSPSPGIGAVLTWGGHHYVCVRFNRDDLPFTIDNKSGTVFVTNGSLELIEELNE